MRYKLSDEIKFDLSDIHEEGELNFGTHQADKYINKLVDAFEFLAEYPQGGPSDPRFFPGIRRKEVNPYTIFYMQKSYGVYIIRIIKQDRIINKRHFIRSLDEIDG